MKLFVSRLHLLSLLAVTFIAIPVVFVAAQEANPVKWVIQSKPAAEPLKSGTKFTVQVTARIAAGWNVYSLTQPEGGPLATRISLPGGQPFILSGRVKAPAHKTKFDENFGIDTEFYNGTATFAVPIIAGKNVSGKQRLKINVFFQACNDSVCLPPQTVKLELPVQLAEAATDDEKQVVAEASPIPNIPQESQPKVENPEVAASPNTESKGSEPGSPAFARVEQKKTGTSAGNIVQSTALSAGFDGSQSLLSFVWLAVTMGALSLLTPCVFPMVPITVSYFTRHSVDNKRGAVSNALIYSAGIIMTFTALGMLLAAVAGAAGLNQFAANPWVNLLITVVFVCFALSLFGAFHIQVPSKLLTRLDAAASGKGKVVGMLLMGLTFTLTSFTCTAPFIGTLLVMASQGEWQWPLLGLLAFSSVFALPFFVLALAPQLVSQLPRGGAWLNSIKVVMGLLEIAAAMKFLSNVDLVWHWGVFTREVVLASWIAITVLIAFYLLGKFKLTFDSELASVGSGRLMGAFVSFALGFYLLTGLFGARLGELESFLPPAAVAEATTTAGETWNRQSASGELPWILNDYEGALESARLSGMPLFVDFTGYTCTNCRWMEANMFPRDAVRKELEKYIRVRLYTDGEGEVYERQQKFQQSRFGTVALPYYAVVDSNGTTVTGFPGLTRSQDEFIGFLRKGLERGLSENKSSVQ